MASVVKHLVKQGLIKPPGFVDGNIQYETVMGSEAYGSSTELSDIDIYGFCIPPQHILFPHLVGIIPGFDRNVHGFEQYQRHHIMDTDAHAGKGQEYDIQIFNIVKYFRLCLDGNPNMLDSLFTPQDCVRFQTQLAVEVRDNRRLFLHAGCWSKLRGYSLSQIGKMKNKRAESGRHWMIEKYGYDLKFAMHAVRLLCEAEQIFTTGDIDLRKDAELYKAIRRGDWTSEEVIAWVDQKALYLEGIKDSCTIIPSKPREAEVKQLLVNCLEHHYGSLSGALSMPDRYKSALMDVQDIINKALG